MGEPESPSGAYRFLTKSEGGRVLATTPSGEPLVVLNKSGKGQVISIGVPLGLGLDDRPAPFLGRLLQHLVQGLAPIRVRGDVEWTLGRLPDGGWLVGLFNNRGVTKPQHGVLPTDHSQAVTVKLRTNWPVSKSEEWMAGGTPNWRGSDCDVTVPAGAVRLIAVYPGAIAVGRKR